MEVARHMKTSPKVYVIADWDSNWYPKNAMRQFMARSACEFVRRPEEADLVWIFSYYMPLDEILAKRKGILRDKCVVATFHHLYRPKQESYMPFLERVNELCDVVHFFSEKNARANRDYFRAPVILLPYWIDTTEFHPLPAEEKKQIRRSLGLPSDKIVIGSFQRDTEADLETPKLEKGPDVFCDVVGSLSPKRYFVLLAGPRRHYVEKRLARCGMPYASLGPIPYERMNGLYNGLDYYLVTSRVEGGPQAILEAMATGTRIYSTPVGISDLLSGDVVFSESGEFVKALGLPYPDVTGSHVQRASKLDLHRVVPAYDEVFASLCDLRFSDRAAAQTRVERQAHGV